MDCSEIKYFDRDLLVVPQSDDYAEFVEVSDFEQLQAENRHMKESLCTMPKCEHVDKLEKKNRRYWEALELVETRLVDGDVEGLLEIIYKALNVH
jgi:hypothetical protein